MSDRTGRPPRGKRSLTIPCHFGLAVLRRQGYVPFPSAAVLLAEQGFAPCALDNARCRELQIAPRSPHGVNVRGAREVGNSSRKSTNYTAVSGLLMEACRAGSSFHVEVLGLHVEVEQAKKKMPSPDFPIGARSVPALCQALSGPFLAGRFPCCSVT